MQVKTNTPRESQRSNALVFLALENRPFTATVAKCALIAMLAYPVLAGLALEGWRGFGFWLDLWAPIVRLLGLFLPIFKTSERTLNSLGLSDRVAIVHHIFAVEWVLLGVIFGYLFVVVQRLPREEWLRFVASVSILRVKFLFFGALIALVVAVYFCVFGLPVSNNPLLAWQKSNLTLTIGASFGSVVVFGIGAQVCLNGYLQWRRSKSSEST
jgi:hypothetical protein